MKYNTCPHCGARITVGQRLFRLKRTICCRECGGVCMLELGPFWIAAEYASLYFPLITQHWYQLSWWMTVVLVVGVLAMLKTLRPLVLMREISRRDRAWDLMAGCLFIVIFWESISVLDRIADEAEPVTACPSAVQSAL
jgi:hypothetical protein